MSDGAVGFFHVTCVNSRSPGRQLALEELRRAADAAQRVLISWRGAE